MDLETQEAVFQSSPSDYRRLMFLFSRGDRRLAWGRRSLVLNFVKVIRDVYILNLDI